MLQITYSQIALFIWIVAAWILCAFFAYKIITKEILRMRVVESIAAISNKIDDFQSRLALIEPRGIEYINSLGAEGAKILYDLRGRMNSLEQFITEIDSLVKVGSRHSLLRADYLLNSSFVDPILARAHSERQDHQGAQKEFKIPFDWDVRIEILFQKFGKMIHASSIRASKAGLRKKRERQSTVHCLREAGIKLLEDG